MGKRMQVMGKRKNSYAAEMTKYMILSLEHKTYLLIFIITNLILFTDDYLYCFMPCMYASLY